MGKLSDEPVLLTGAAGFIGSHVATALIARGQPVIGIDNLNNFYDPGIKRANLREIEAAAQASNATASNSRFEFIHADITDSAAIAAAFARAKPRSVIHLAAKAGVRPSIADPAGYMHTNVVGTSVILEECRKHDISRAVVASSSSVYGNAPEVPFREDQDVSRPISPYAASKRATELVCWTHHLLTGLPIACLRFFTVFGPRQRPDLAIQHFIASISSGKPIRMFGDGSTSRDYTFIADIVRGVLATHDRIGDFRAPGSAGTSSPESGRAFRTWNLGGHQPISLTDMIATIERVVGKKAIIERQPMQPGDVERTYADLTRSSAELDFHPETSFEDGVKRQWEWWKTRMEAKT
jgi:UDP-glucuronate 4-epimerase